MRKTITTFVLAILALIASPIVAFYGCVSLNEHLRVRDAESAFRPVEHLGCEIWSQPYGSRYCRYLVEFHAGSSLNDNNIEKLASLNALPESNQLDVVIATEDVTDASISALANIETIDLLDVTRSGISDEGIERLKKELSGTLVNSRK